MKTFIFGFTVLGLAVLPGFAYADKVETRIQGATEAYQEGDYADAIEELESAVAEIQEKLNQRYLMLLPEAPAGWEAREGEAQTDRMALMGGGTHLIREYVRDEEQITVEMMANSPMLAALNIVLNNPAMLAGTPNTEPYRYKTYRGIKKIQDNGNVEVSLLVGNTTLIQLKGSNLEDPETLEKFLDAMDFDKIKQMIAS